MTGGDFAPISDHVHLFRCEPHEACEVIRQSWDADYPLAQCEVDERAGDLRTAFGALLPCRVPFGNRCVVMRTSRPGWTAVFSNAATGRVGAAAGRVGHDRWAFAAFVRRGALEYAVALKKFAQEDPPHEGRTVRVFLGDTRVELGDFGEPWSFEESYPKRLRRDSITADLMRRYVEDLGFSWVWDEAQYAPDGRFWLVSTSFTNRNFWEVPLEQARATYLADLASGRGLR